MKKLTHIDAEGKARMVDVSDKTVTVREAVARGFVSMKPETVRLILDKNIPKG
ncbi:MAG: molybdenum cofactor biosynthesis protein [Nitrospirae bacterium]|nr:molybdenum cofactor biosynthesis protein [Nitrospirota bacterium]